MKSNKPNTLRSFLSILLFILLSIGVSALAINFVLALLQKFAGTI